ncbi:hypothetical protein Pcinc_039999 [Petrolisthes cinctipes]|uniref:Uncharacterized protein n=1 Tax=Petrolisthes cinctipes TaxID=88211 RepID=A0AAE1ELA1_PETCI|nr:hypothetical protein Pcinc_039999 [Petrolisthes cinctipes]
MRQARMDGQVRQAGRQAGRSPGWTDGRAGWRRLAARNDTFVGPEDSSPTDFFTVKILRVGRVGGALEPIGGVLVMGGSVLLAEGVGVVS